MHEAVRDAPPAAKLAYRTLDREGDATLTDVAEDNYLHENTARYALEKLDDADVLESRNDHSDARQTVYSLQR